MPWTDNQIASLYRVWSEEHYAAGWLNVDVEVSEGFARWVVEGGGERIEDYEIHDIPMLRDALERAHESAEDA